MKVIFCRSNLPISLLIRLFTWSKWSHCGVIVGDQVIHSTITRGVDKEHLDSIKNRYKYEIRYIDGDANKAEDLIGCKYDRSGAIGHLFGFNDPNRYGCAKVIAYCSNGLNKNIDSFITPKKGYKISKPLVKVN